MVATLDEAKLVKSLKLALTDGITGGHEWVPFREVKVRLAHAQFSFPDPELTGWLSHLEDAGKVESKTEGGKVYYRLNDVTTEMSPGMLSRDEIHPKKTFEPPKRTINTPPRKDWPAWAKDKFDAMDAEIDKYHAAIHSYKVHIEKMEKTNMEQERSLTLNQYGDNKDLTTIKDRVGLTAYGDKLDNRGRQMVAQICYLLDWNPFFDMHAWEQGGKLCMMPDYKKLLSMAKEQQRINHSSRPMTEQERQDNGLTDAQVGFVTEVKEIDTFLEFARAGVADEYSPIIGYGIWSQKDRIPATWTKEMVARKRSLRNALYQLTNYKIVSKRFHDALMQVGAVSVSDADDGFLVDLPEQDEQPKEITPLAGRHFWGFKEQRKRFWIAAGELGKSKTEQAAALNFKIEGDPEDSANWVETMIDFPDLENAIAYVGVVAENIHQQAEENAVPEVVPDDTEPVVIDGETGEVLAATPVGDHWWLDSEDRQKFWINNTSAGRNAEKVAQLLGIPKKHADTHDAQEWWDAMKLYANVGEAMVSLMRTEQEANES